MRPLWSRKKHAQDARATFGGRTDNQYACPQKNQQGRNPAGHFLAKKHHLSGRLLRFFIWGGLLGTNISLKASECTIDPGADSTDHGE